MKQLIALSAIALGLAMSGPAFAHGAKAKHGGVVQSAGDLSFELVSKDGKAVIYIDDHGSALPTTGATGTLTVLAGTSKSETPLEATAPNALSSKADVKLLAGTKAIASIKLQGKDAISVRFLQK